MPPDPAATAGAELEARVLEQAAALALARMREMEQRGRLAHLSDELARTRERLDLAEHQRERDQQTLRDVIGSPSWRLTEPLRGIKRVDPTQA